MIRVFETQNMDLCGILATIDGIDIGLLSVDLVNGKHCVSYRNEYNSKLQPVVDELIKQYEQKNLMINANKLCFHLSFLRFLHNKKVKEFKTNHKER